MKRVPCFALTFLLLTSSSSLSQEFAAKELPMHINITYYDCILPEDSICIAGTEEEKRKCSRCQQWKKAEFDEVLTSYVDHDAYVYRKGSPRANQFVADVKGSLAMGIEVKSRSTAPRFAALYQDPLSYGLITVEPSQPTDGLLLSRRMGGVLIRTAARPTLIHPSDERNGDLWMNPPQLVFGSEATKLTVPIEPILKKKREKLSLTWNAWADDPPEIALQPVDVLQREHGYRIVLDLSGFAYRNQNQRAASTQTVDWLAKWLDNTSDSTTQLTVLMLTDSHFTPSVIKAEMSVSLDKLRDWRRNPYSIGGNPFDQLRNHSDGMAGFVFGRGEFAVRTTGRTGRAAVTFSIWNNKGRPIDEVATSFCVETCEGEAFSSGLMGIDSISPGSASDAALHFIQIGNQIRGIFHCVDRPSAFEAWDVATDRASFMRDLREVMKEFHQAKGSRERIIAAGKFANVLFPSRNPDAQRVRTLLNDFVTTHVESTAPSAPNAPSFFVRMLAVTGDPVPPVPFGLYPMPASILPDEPDLGYLGFYFRVENPLEIQSYDSDGRCIRQWFLVYAQSGPEELTYAATALSENVLRKWPRNGSFRHFPTMSGEKGFGEWIRSETGDDPEAAIFILGHHGEEDGVGRIVLNEGDILRPNDVRRIFKRPSVAILNACGTALAGAEDFVRAFNSGNVTAVVATKYEVAPAMAVQFAECLNEQMVKAPSSEESLDYNLSYAVFEATHCLRRKKAFRTGDPTKEEPGAAPWGARAIAYSLIGNGGLMLCTPEENRP